MHYGMKSGRFARLFTYEQARKHYESIKSFTKGRNKGKSPFCERERYWLQIRRDWDDIVIKLYDTDIIRYKPNGDIIVNQGGWVTASTHETIARILGTEIMQRDHRGWVKAHIEGSNELGYYLLPKGEDCVFRGVWGELGKCTIYQGLMYMNPPTTLIHKLNRPRYAEVMQIYKPFIDYMKRMFKVSSNGAGEVCDQAGTAESEPMPKSSKETCESMIDVYTHGHRLYTGFVKQAVRNKYSGYYLYHREPDQLPVKWEDIKKIIFDMIKKSHADYIFEGHEVQTGRVSKDANRKYMVGVGG